MIKMDESPDESPYRPVTATITDVRLEAGGERPIRSFRVKIDDEAEHSKFDHVPGQFVMISVFGTGEAPFAISSPSNDEGELEFTIMRMGKVTNELHSLDIGDKIGVRGPYGNGFPVDDWKGKDIFFIGAGIGIAPLRSVYEYVLDDERRDEYGEITLIYGARSTDDFAYVDRFEELERREDVLLWRCIDWETGDEGLIEECAEEGWEPINLSCPADTELKGSQRCYTAFVPQMVEAVGPEPKEAVALTCGPPIAIRLTLEALDELGWDPSDVYTTLENRMKCGIGKCGRCNIGNYYVCKDGPVFTYEQLKEMKPETEVK